MTPKQCREIWRGAVPELTFNIKGIEAEILLSQSEGLPDISAAILIEAKLDKSPFKIFVARQFISDILSSPQIDMDIEKIGKQELAIVIEHIFTPTIERLEEILDGKIDILSVQKSEENPRIHGLAFSIKANNQIYDGVFVNGDFGILNKIASALEPYYAPGEKEYPDICDVIIGPIELSQSEIDNLSLGDLVSIGQKMDAEIKGYIVRKSGTFWHSELEPTRAIITSKMGKISQIKESSNGKILAGIKIGHVNITPLQVPKISVGDVFQIERIKDNIAHLMINDRNIASGNLQNVSEILCLAIDELEQINADG